KPLWEAINSGDSAAMLAAIQKGVWEVPLPIRALNMPLPSAQTGPLTFPTGLQVVVSAQRPRFDQTGVRRADIVPLAGLTTASSDAAQALRTTMRRSARRAVLESFLFHTTAGNLLSGGQLAYLPPFADVSQAAPGLALDAHAAWTRLLAPYG